MFIEGEAVVNSWWSDIFGLPLFINTRVIQVMAYLGQFYFEFY